ncbi:MAG: translation initiation factor IF-2 [Eubacterium sp.]|jgi:translation initiation factor IF-2
MKVFELAKKLKVTSKDVISHAQEAGIELKSHMNNLTDEQEAAIEKTFPKAKQESKPAAAGSPASKPAAKSSADAASHSASPGTPRKRPFIGKPRVNSDFLDSREKAVKEASEKKETEQMNPVEREVPEQPAKPAAESKQEVKPAAEKTAQNEQASEHVSAAEEKQEPQKKEPQKQEPEASEKPKAADKQKVSEEPKPHEAPEAAAEQNPAEKPKAEKHEERKQETSAADEKKQQRQPENVQKPNSAAEKKAKPSPEPVKPAKPAQAASKPAEKAAPKPAAKPAPKAATKPAERPHIGLKIIKRAGEDEQQAPSTYERRRPGDRNPQQERGQERGQERRGGGREKPERKRDRRAPQGGSAQRAGDSRDRNRAGAPQGRNDSRSESSRQGGRKKQNERFDREQHNKFDKLERKSLEKQTRNKHAKYKNTAEPEPEEQIVIPEGTIVLNVPITVAGFCEQTEISTSKVIMTLMKLGIMANINQNIDEDTVTVLADELGISVHIANVDNTEEELEAEELDLEPDDEKDLKPRPPIITVMGHVDHGKTSLLDAIRKTNVTAKESGGITQHIGASEVRVNGQKIVFLDTPGHEAFTAMRARGAHITDIAVLVVAADDGVMPQTVESISHAKAAGVPIIVAINKMDKPHANPERVKQELADHGVIVEDYGGDVISVPVSAKTGEGISTLLEMILLQAEVLELKANPNRLASGSVIEARLDKSKGPVATLLVMNGTLQAGQSIVAGTCAGRIRLMTDYKGKAIKKAGPATAVEVLGLTDVPQAGDDFNAVSSDKVAKEIAGKRAEKMREEVMKKNSSMSLEKFFSQMKEGEVKELNLIIKGDVQGSIGAVVSSLEKLNNDEVKVNIIHSGVGAVTESDIMLAGTSGAVIIGFNVRPSSAVQAMADREGVEIRSYTVIYDVINDVEAAMKGMLEPEYKEEVLGKAEIRNTFKVPGIGIVGGAYVQEGKIVRNSDIRLVRDGVVIHEGKISSLKRFKDDAKEVAQGYECGIGIEDYNDIKEGDVIECYHMVEVKRS